MLQYNSALGLPKAFNSTWEKIDVLLFKLEDLFISYEDIIISVLVESEERYYSLSEFKIEFMYFQGNINDFHIALNDRAVTWIPKLPNSVKYVRYENAYRCGYSLNVGLEGRQYFSGYDLDFLKDAVMTRRKNTTDMHLLERYCLISVNGLIHRVKANETQLYILDATTTLKLSNRNHVGILSFQDIGDIEIHQILEADIGSIDDQTNLYRKLLITTVPLTNKYPILILGGYLVLPHPDYFYQISDTSLAISIECLPYLERIVDSINYLDLSSMYITKEDIYSRAIGVEFLTSNDTIKLYMTLSQTFLVLINVSNMHYKTESIFSRLPGIFTTAQEPIYPIITNHGKIMEYWKTQESNHWSLTSENTHYQDPVTLTTRQRELPAMSNAYTLEQRNYRNFAHILKIGSYS